MEEDRLMNSVEQREVYESQMTSLWTEVTHEDVRNGYRDSEVEDEEESSDSTSDTSCTLDSDEDSTSLTDTCDEEDADDIPEAAAVSASGSSSKEYMYSDDYERQQLLAWQQQLRQTRQHFQHYQSLYAEQVKLEATRSAFTPPFSNTMPAVNQTPVVASYNFPDHAHSYYAQLQYQQLSTQLYAWQAHLQAHMSQLHAWQVQTSQLQMQLTQFQSSLGWQLSSMQGHVSRQDAFQHEVLKQSEQIKNMCKHFREQ